MKKLSTLLAVAFITISSFAQGGIIYWVDEIG